MNQLEEIINLVEERQEIEIDILCKPISMQSKSREKKNLKNKINSIARQFDFILYEDVQIDIRWIISEQERYECDSSADVDNIIKPIIDAISGKDGLIVNDCQVQSISSYWMDLGKLDQSINILIKILEPQGWILKKDLVFIHLQKGLCFPTNRRFLQEDSVKETKKSLENIYIHYREKCEQKNIPYHHYRMSFMQNRLFHISRLKEFDVINLSNL